MSGTEGAPDSLLFLSPELLRQADIGVVEFSGSGEPCHASARALQLLGLPQLPATPADAGSLQQLVTVVREAESADGAVIRSRLLSPTGEPLAATAQSVLDGSGDTRVICLLRRAEMVDRPRSVPRHRDDLEIMLDGCQDGLWLLSPAGDVIDANRAATQLVGISPEAARGSNARDILERAGIDPSPLFEVAEKRVPTSVVQTLGDGRKLLVGVQPVLGPAEELRRVLLSLRDITDTNRLMTRYQETAKLSETYRRQLRQAEVRQVEADRVVARSGPMRRVWDLALRYAAVESPVLLLGETGAGKGVFAKVIHHASARSLGPFLEVNCGALPEGLIEPELFGYARGAFTGADSRGKPGLVELADGGTLLLDEIGDLPYRVQVKLLRFLEDGEMWPVGAVKAKRPDVRIIAATNRDLSRMLADGGFRRDLFYRLNVLTIDIPPLRERAGDIPALVEMMLAQLERKLRRRPTLTPEALERICRYEFPGNVRELWNLIERLAVTSGEIIDVKDFPAELREAPDGRRSLRDALRKLEADMLREALDRFGTQSEAAKHLGVGQATIARKAKLYGLNDSETPPGDPRRRPPSLDRGRREG